MLFLPTAPKKWRLSGVYFGWAALEEDEGGPWKCVANVGYSPTFAGEENAEKIVEGHLIGYKGLTIFLRTRCCAPLLGSEMTEADFLH